MPNNNREFESTLIALRTRGCHVNREWLHECVDFFCSENNQYTLEDVQKFVFEQWTLGDLCDVAGTGSLPPNLGRILKTTLDGRMACQIQFVTDIGHSSYTQMQNLRNEDIGNLQVDEVGQEFQQAWEPKSNRMLHLSLFDGIQTVKAIEYRPIPLLKTDLIPGTKILLKGPILCRRGVLMLEEKNLAILGGEVEALVIANAYENVLARTLNLPENPDPYKLNAATNNIPQPQPEEFMQGSAEQPARHPLSSQPQRTTNTNQRPAPSVVREQSNPRMVQASLSWPKPAPQAEPIDFCGDDEDFLNIPLNEVDWETEMLHDNRPTSNQHNLQNVSNQVDRLTSEFDLGSDDEAAAALLAAEASLAVNLGKPVGKTKTMDFLSFKPRTVLEDNSLSYKRPASSALPEESLRKPLFSKRRKETSSQEVSSTSDLSFLLADDFLDLEETPDTSKNLKAPLILPPFPFLYLSQIIGFEKNSSKSYKVKAAVMTIIEKLSICGSGWKLSAKITDGSANVNVTFCSKVLEEIIGMSPKVLSEMRKRIPQNPENKDVVRKTLELAQKKMINLNCLFDIQMSEEHNLPLVIGLKDISINTVTALKCRQRQVKV